MNFSFFIWFCIGRKDIMKLALVIILIYLRINVEKSLTACSAKFSTVSAMMVAVAIPELKTIDAL